MKIVDYSLRVRKDLLTNVSVDFCKGRINHILGQNGSGKSCFAKSILGRFKYKGRIDLDAQNVALIGSYSNIPLEFKIKDVVDIITRHCEYDLAMNLFQKLKVEQLEMNSKLKKLSDGQRQKIKLLFYLANKPEIIILDEFTNALDKETCKEVYTFLRNYIQENNNCTILNITHNLSDLEYMEGEYFLINDKKIKKINDKEQIIKLYIEGV